MANPPQTYTTDQPVRAASFMVLSAALIAGSTFFAKVAGTWSGDPIHPLQVSHARFLFAFLPVLLVVITLRPKLQSIHLKLHVARTLFGWTGATLMFAAAAMIPLADATALSFLSPIFTMLLAAVFLGEKVGSWRWSAVLISFSGGLILLRPGGDGLQTGALLALTAALSMGIEVAIIKRLTGREPPLQILAINNTIGLCIASLVVVAVWQWPSPGQWAILACVGVAMVAAQACFLQAMRSSDASAILPLTYTVLIFASVYDFLVFSVLPDWVSYLGAGIILTGAGLVTWREARRRAAA
ncbi:MAG: DMT family transporter [Pseudomonadota bacterium]